MQGTVRKAAAPLRAGCQLAVTPCRNIAARYEPERKFKDFPVGPESISMPFDGGRLRVDQIKEKLDYEKIDKQVWEMKRQLAIIRMRKNGMAAEPYRGHEAKKVKRQIARMLTARRQLEVSEGVSARQSRKVWPSFAFEHWPSGCDLTASLLE